jgi:hypothetical protein
MDGVAATGRHWLALSKGNRLTRKPDWALKINGGKLEIEPPMAKAKVLALCLAANGYLKWRACGAIFASSRGYPLFGMDQSPLARRAGPAGIFRARDEV